MKRFILLLNHDDTSLSAYLQHCLEKGEQFVKSSGNIFTFKKTEPSDERIAVVTYVSDNPDLKMKFQMEDYSALMKKRGWKVLHIGSPEDIFDSKRHVFLQTDQSDLPLPAVDAEMGKKAKKHETRSLIRCIAMLLLLLGFGIFFLGHDPDIFLSSNHILIPCAAAFLAWAASLVCAAMACGKALRKPDGTSAFGNYLIVDKAVLFCMISIGFLLAALVLDQFMYPNTARTVVHGEQRISIYQDDIPLMLEDLSLPAEGRFRSRRVTERSGFLMQSLYGSDQSFTDPNSSVKLSMISYAVYRSGWQGGLDWVSGRKGLRHLPLSGEMAEQWHSEEVHSDGNHRLSARYPGILLVFYSSSDLSEIDPAVVLEKLQIP